MNQIIPPGAKAGRKQVDPATQPTGESITPFIPLKYLNPRSMAVVRFLRWSILALAPFFMTGCRPDRFDVDLSDSKVEVQILRFDTDLAAVTRENLLEQIPRLESRYGSFFDLFNHQIIRIGSPSQKDYASSLFAFLEDPVMTEASNDTRKTFPDLKQVNTCLNKAFSYYHFYFPEKTIPRVFTFFGGFNQSIITDSGLIGIGLDKYLGTESRYYQMLNVPQYLRGRMKPDRICLDCMAGWANSEFESRQDGSILDHFIEKGKVIYFLRCMFPDLPEQELFGYSEQDLKWLVNSEKEMWNYLIEKQLLFKSDYKLALRLTGEAPFTSLFSEESPGRAGIWIGWKIVSRYMEKNPELRLADLMKETDSQTILQKSGYNP